MDGHLKSLAKAVRMPEAFLQTEKTKRHAGAEKG